MADPTAPNIPADAPQDVRDFFECRGSKLLWRSGDVSWLGLKISPSVTFEPGANAGSVNITVGLLSGMVGFTLPASVNAAGELVVDTSSVPDLSEWGLGGRADIDAAIKRINDWFKHNGKRLKPAHLRDGIVTLEKESIATMPAVVPMTPAPPTTPVPLPVTPPPATPSAGGGWCSMLMVLVLLMFVGVIAIGGGIGFMFFGGQAAPTSLAGPTASSGASATPTTPSSSEPIPTPGPSHSAPTDTSSPPAGQFTAVCIRVVHDQVGEFISYLDWVVWWTDYNVEYFEVTVIGANDDEPGQLEFETREQAYKGILGLHQKGDKRIVSVIAHMSDGSEIDLTNELVDAFGSDEFSVRYPQEDQFGNCPD